MKYSVKEVYFQNEIFEGINFNSLSTPHQPESSDQERWRTILFALTVDISFFLSSFLLTHFLEMHILCIMGDVKWTRWWILLSKNLKGYELSILMLRVQRRWNDFWLRLVWGSVSSWVWREAAPSLSQKHTECEGRVAGSGGWKAVWAQTPKARVRKGRDLDPILWVKGLYTFRPSIS